MAGRSFRMSLTLAESGDDHVVYASTDDGFNDDDASEAGDDFANHHTTAPSSKLGPADLIDLSDGDFATRPSETADNSPSKANQPVPPQPDAPLPGDKQNSSLDNYSQATKTPDPSAQPFVPLELERVAPSSSNSSYTDARQSLDSRDDQIQSLTNRVKELEHSHETLKRENDDLDTVNEKLKLKARKDDESLRELREQLAEELKRRLGSEKKAVEVDEKNAELHVEVARLQEEKADMEPQLEEYKKKLDGSQKSVRPLENMVHTLQRQVLDKTQRIKEIQLFAADHLAKNPQDIPEFATMDLFPHGGKQEHQSGKEVNPELLISFDGAVDMSASGSQLNESQSEIGTPFTVSSIRAPSTPQPHHASKDLLDDDPADTQSPQTLPIMTPSTPKLQREESLTPQSTTESHTAEPKSPSDNLASPPKDISGLDWSPDSDQLWISEFQKAQAIRNHQGARSTDHTPGMFTYGIRFVRQYNRQKLMTEDGIPDVASRRVIMSGLPDGVHVQRILEHVRGGKILKAHTVTMGRGEARNNLACIEFADPEDAMEFYRFNRCREFGFCVESTSVRTRLTMPSTDSFPLSDALQARLGEGCTRCLSVTDFPVIHLQTILEFAGMSNNFADTITHFACSDDGSFEISFSDIRCAINIREYILRSKFFQGEREGTGVCFKPDPCDAPVESLQIPFLPIKATSDLTILDPKNARLFMTEEQRKLDSELLQEQVMAAADPDDADAFHEQDLRKNIVWENKVDWDSFTPYMAFDKDQRRRVLHRKDPESGAVQTQYFGSWVQSPAESRKEWLHHNQHSPHPWTQTTADLFYAATGDIDMRKSIVVDDGGLDGDADQALNTPTPREIRRQASSTTSFYSAESPLSEVNRGYMTLDDTSQHVPMGVFVNHVGSSSGLAIPSLLDGDTNVDMNNSVQRTQNLPPHKRGKTRGSTSGLSSPAPSIMDDDTGGQVCGISKAGFNQLAAKIARDTKATSSKSIGKRPVAQAHFW
ncbi:unnamed protein product [Colletotrichum noveboracense]|uniref:Uncharacterized protein n=1 Tax=Colletotrichum noveboracense TaxID=2664923 RepID=A0A9W4WDK7_9PEZI|nr:hypothetical protein CBS470a_012036 [Colletotrichum nupharicola]KAJ0305725.1 hypothetical protein Brms1b_010706 [Colletotrichum noveboracense]CAI0648314.1 unnamed protein product [Colletotrichum noveboracense]